jgi:hypothetical protein
MNTRMRMLGFYTYYLTELDLRPDILTWMKNAGYSKSEMALVKSGAPADTLLFTASKLARAMNRGMPSLHPDAQNYFDKKFNEGLPVEEESQKVKARDDAELVRAEIRRALGVLQAKATASPEVTSVAKVPKQNPQLLLRDKVDKTVISFLEEMIDSWGVKQQVLPLANLLSLVRDNNTSEAGCVLVQKWLEKNLAQFQEALDDPKGDVAEGFAYLTKAGLKSRIKAFEKMLEDVAKCANQKKALRKPRVKKVKDASKQVARLKFQPASQEFGVSSVTPTRMPCSYQICTFNTKYRTLSFYQASGPAGFEVKGSGLKGFCPKESFTTTLRKPEKLLTQILGATPNKILKVLETLTTKKRAANGRFNESTIILRVIEKKSL